MHTKDIFITQSPIELKPQRKIDTKVSHWDLNPLSCFFFHAKVQKKTCFRSGTYIQQYVYILGMPPEATVCSRPHQQHSVSSWFLNDLWMWPSGGCQRWRPPEWRGPDGRGYKYTSCLSGTAKCFYSLTEACVRVRTLPPWRARTCQSTLRSRSTHSLQLLNMHQALVARWCRICVSFVSDERCRLLMPGDMFKGSRHKWVFPAAWHTIGDAIGMRRADTGAPSDTNTRSRFASEATQVWKFWERLWKAWATATLFRNLIQSEGKKKVCVIL